MSKKRSPAKTFAFVLVACAIILFSINFAIRFFQKPPAVTLYQNLYKTHPDRMYELAPGAVLSPQVGVFGPFADQWKKANLTYNIKINDQGFRQADAKLAKGAIICLGDSSTFGWDVEEEQAYPHLLSKMLSANVQNFGVPGYSTHQGRILLEQRIWELEPKLLILAYGRNDELDTAFAPTTDGLYRQDKELMPFFDSSVSAPHPTLFQRFRTTALYRFVLSKIAKAKKYDSARAQSPNIKRRVQLKDYKANLTEMIKEAKKRNVKVVFMALGMLIDNYKKALLEVGKAEGVPAVDMTSVFYDWVPQIKTDPEFIDCRKYLKKALGKKTLESSDGGWLYFSTDFGHPNGCGHIIVAKTLQPIIETVLSKDQPQPQPESSSSSSSD